MSSAYGHTKTINYIAPQSRYFSPECAWAKDFFVLRGVLITGMLVRNKRGSIF